MTDIRADYPRFMISAPSSGSGKSVITAGLMRAFSQSMRVQGFKVGPDYIDPMYHTAATGRPSRNLDSWMLAPETNRQIFARATEDADLAIIEGVMGLFDGFASNPSVGSSAEMAKLLSCPVIAVIDCGKMSGSAAAIAKGLDSLDPALRLSGVICNRAGSPNHAEWLKEAIEQYAELPVLGTIPKLDALKIPERQLGLHTVAENPQEAMRFLDGAANVVTEHLDLDKILQIARNAADFAFRQPPQTNISPTKVRLAVALDQAFCFYYEDNLDALRDAGAEIIFFSPLKDRHLPEDIAGIYLGGGYPELYAEQLSQNTSLLHEIYQAIAENMPVYAESGGLIMLTEGIHTQAGDFAMVGALPGWAETGKHLTMGYRLVHVRENTLLACANDELRGHEFHYSTWESPTVWHCAHEIAPRRQSENTQKDGWVRKNLLASQVHLHFLQDKALASRFVNTCLKWRLGNNHD